MKAQAAIEFLYTYGFVIILALVVISLIFHYFSLSLGSAPQCIMPYYLRCEQFIATQTQISLNLTNNFNYDLMIREIRVRVQDREYRMNVDEQVRRGKSILISIPISENAPQLSAKLNITYSPCVDGGCLTESYSVLGYITSPLEGA